MDDNKVTIDATDQVLGRIASRAALLLRGKKDPNFIAHITPSQKVEIVNASKVKLSEKKRRDTIYNRYTGYPGGLRERTMQEIIDLKGYSELFRKAVYGMLAPNKLRDVIMKNLTIVD